jgi:hypothetical protein
LIFNDQNFLLRVDYASSYDPDLESVTGTLREFLEKALTILIPRVLFVPYPDIYFTRIADIEEGFARSLTFYNVFMSASNLVGSKPICLLPEWLHEQGFPLRRAEPVRFDAAVERKEEAKLAYGVGEPPEELLNTERLRHGQRRVLSLIDVELWSAAEWGGVATALYRSGPPVLALLFKNEEPARRIFESWRNQFGERDEEDIIRIAFVTGIDKHSPSSYVIVISTNIERAFKDRKPFEQVIVVSRMQRIDRPDPSNLRVLMTMHRAAGCYALAPAVLDEDSKQPRLLSETGILKRELNVRPAWQIGEHDPDVMALSPDDDPIIPEGVVDPPVEHALRGLRRRRRKGNS